MKSATRTHTFKPLRLSLLSLSETRSRNRAVTLTHKSTHTHTETPTCLHPCTSANAPASSHSRLHPPSHKDNTATPSSRSLAHALRPSHAHWHLDTLAIFRRQGERRLTCDHDGAQNAHAAQDAHHNPGPEFLARERVPLPPECLTAHGRSARQSGQPPLPLPPGRAFFVDLSVKKKKRSRKNQKKVLPCRA